MNTLTPTTHTPPAADAARRLPGMPLFPYGGVYFRKSGPPRDDWERDYARAAQDGMNAFRHWFLWSAVEVAPGVWDWDDYDRQLDLGAKYDIKTVVGEITHAAPEWAFRKYAHARFEAADGRRIHSQMRNSSVTGGFPGLCLDNDDARELAGNWLATLARRYADHPGMGAWDVWNECNLHSSGLSSCYCAGTQARFRRWLRARYDDDLKALARAWRRYSLADWDDIEAPRDPGPYPDYMDWTRFRIENAHDLLRWRCEIVRAHDPAHPITAHGVGDSAIRRLVSAADDPWRAAAPVDGYGYTGGCAYFPRPSRIYQHLAATDIARAGARGKPFWGAERAGGPSWIARNAEGRDTGYIPGAGDIRIADFDAMAGGTRGLFSPRWRPLMDGPLFDCYGYYALDGSPTERSAMASTIARWANAPAREALWRSAPVRGDIGLLVVPESQIYVTLWQGKPDPYGGALRGLYRACLAADIQADFVHPDDMDRYDLLYLPCPIALSEDIVRRLTAWVEAGGTLVSDGCPGLFGDNGHTTGDLQPGLGLDTLFGARQTYGEYSADLLERDEVTCSGDSFLPLPARLYRAAYAPADGATVAATYSDSRGAAVIDHAYGKGHTRLLGSVAGLAGGTPERDAVLKDFCRSLLTGAEREPHLTRREGGPEIVARLHAGDGGDYLWLLNHGDRAVRASLTLAERYGPYAGADVQWGSVVDAVAVDGRTVSATIPPLDALVLALIPSEERAHLP